MMKCEIIRDLIPLYLDKVCSEDSRKLVEEHLAECSECRKYMKELETELEAVKQKKEEDLDEKRLLQEGAERMKEIGKKSIVEKMIIVDTLLNFLLIVTASIVQTADRYLRCRCGMLYSSHGIQLWIYYRILHM